MEGKRVEDIMQSYGIVNVSYDGMPVWIEGVRGDVAKVTLIGKEKTMDVPVCELTETEPQQG